MIASQSKVIHGAEQRGIAAILLLLLVGMTLTAMVLGTSAYLRQQQVYTLSNHAQTQAQLKAWTGAELVRQYLQNVQTQGKWAQLMGATFPQKLTLQGEGVEGVIEAQLVAVSTGANTVTSQIIGVGAKGSPAEARVTLESIFKPEGESKTGELICTASSAATTVLRGNLKIGGGGSSFLSDSGYADLAIDGDLTVGGGGAAISGCATGDISMTGGGIKDNASLFTENGSINVQSMTEPKNATFWAGRNIEIGNTGIASYQALKAGAYVAQVVDAAGVVRGSTRAGGFLLPATTTATLPWQSGGLVPPKSGKLRVTLIDGAQYVVDMGHEAVTVDSATGVVQGAVAASQKLNAIGNLAMPDRFSLVAQSVYGGLLSLYALNVQQLWGYDVRIQGWDGTYKTVWSAGNMQAVTGRIESLVGGGDLWFTQGGCSSPSNCWNVPSFSQPSRIAGKLYLGSNKQPMSGVTSLQVEQRNVSPGLPGAPFCDTRSPGLDVASLKSQANYVFHFKDVNGTATPFLTIQNVNQNVSSSEQRSVAKQDINLKTVDLNEHTAANLQVRQIGGKGFISCGNQAYDNLWNDSLSCLRNASPTTGWNLTGITRFPPGVAWFEGALIIDGVGGTRVGSNALYNTLLATGNITLTGSGHGPLIAPNFVTPVSAMCGGDFYPSNLCKRDIAGTWSLTTWDDAQKQRHSGLPIGNIAVATNTSLSVSSWDDQAGAIKGNVLVGTAVTTSGAGLKLYGTINIGMNVKSGTQNVVDLSQGSGLKVDSRGLPGSDGGHLPSNSCQQVPNGGGSQPSGVRLLWSRFL